MMNLTRNDVWSLIRDSLVGAALCLIAIGIGLCIGKGMTVGAQWAASEFFNQGASK
jgi:hypothetical protein